MSVEQNLERNVVDDDDKRLFGVPFCLIWCTYLLLILLSSVVIGMKVS